MSYSFSPVATDELSDIQELAYEIWPVYYASIISQDQIEYMLRELYSLPALEQQAAAGQHFFLLKKGKKSIGFWALSPKTEKEVKLDKLYLLDDFRGQNLGREMMDEAIRWAKVQGFSTLILNVNRFNASLSFYEKLGFQIREEIDIPFGPFFLNDFIMEKAIG